MSARQSPGPDGPQLSVVRGDPAPEEVAALVAVVAARARAAEAARAAASARRPRSAWRDRERLLRRPPRPGPGAWARSFHPG